MKTMGIVSKTIVLFGVTSAVVGSSYMSDYLSLNAPKDKQPYVAGAQCNITGHVYYRGEESETDKLLVRARIFAPSQNGFAIQSEKLVRVSTESAKDGRYPFSVTLKAPKKTGRYLVRVDCLDQRKPTYPDSLVATSSVFVDVRAADHNTVTINTPNKTDNFGTTASIDVAGDTNNNDVKKVRIRLYFGNQIQQEETVNVAMMALTWEGTLVPGGGTWKNTGDHTIKAQGLDEHSKEISGETDSVGITIGP